MRMRPINWSLMLVVIAVPGCAASDFEPVAGEDTTATDVSISQCAMVEPGDCTALDSATFSFVYGSSSNTETAIANTPDGGYVTGGKTPAGSYDAWVTKFDSMGERVWERRYGTPADDSLTALAVTSNGDIVFTGVMRQGSLDGSLDVWLVRLSPTGDIIWQKAYGGMNTLNRGGHEEATSLIETADGNIAVVGGTGSFARSGALYDVVGASFFLEVDGNTGAIVQSEALVWSRYYNDAGRRNTSPFSIVQTADGGFAIAGVADQNFWALKMSRWGVPVWMNHYGYTTHDYINSLVQDADGHIVLAGPTCNASGQCDVWTVKVDQADGSILWAKKINGARYGKQFEILKVDAGFVVAGTYEPIDASWGSGLWLLKLDEGGNLGTTYPGTWQKTYGGLWGTHIALRPGGGFLFAGRRGRFTGSGGAPFYIGTDAEGEVSCPVPTPTTSNSSDGTLARSVCPLPPTGESCCTDSACSRPGNPVYDTCLAHETCVARVCIPKPVNWVRGHELASRDTIAVATAMTGTKETCR